MYFDNYRHLLRYPRYYSYETVCFVCIYAFIIPYKNFLSRGEVKTNRNAYAFLYILKTNIRKMVYCFIIPNKVQKRFLSSESATIAKSTSNLSFCLDISLKNRYNKRRYF